MSQKENTNSKAIPLIVYHVREDGEKSYWNRIGVAWAHKDGKGFNGHLDCSPLDGRITVRVASEEK